MYESGQNPEAIVEASGVRQISDEGELGAVISRILEANPGKVDAYQSGKTGLIGFFVGQVMRETKGQANPQVVNKLLKNLLGD
jgi:Asp-tRNA(Asn)/Glu-tRNA(Gln) amidotransferase B subunit